MLDSEPNSALKFNGENGPDEDDSFDKKEVEEEDLSDFEKDLYGEVGQSSAKYVNSLLLKSSMAHPAVRLPSSVYQWYSTTLV